MKITFLGTGGGRFATISQRRMTGGFRIDDLNGKNYHIDPGPGALVRSYQFGLNPSSLNGIFISHAHTDHYTDAEIMIEAMTRGMTKKNGVIIGSKSVFNGYKKWGPCISNYHKGNSENIILCENNIKKLNNIEIKATKTIHGDPTCIGFQINYEDFKLSYTSDTKFFEGLTQDHQGANILIASVIRPGTKSIKGHMCSNNFVNLVNEIKPQLAIMTHFGFKMLNENPVSEAKFVEEETGIRTLAAFDGMSIEVNRKNPDKSSIISLRDKNAKKYNQNTSYSSSFKNLFSENKDSHKQNIFEYNHELDKFTKDF